MGQTKMGKYDFSSWTLHMASIIIFATLWGLFLKEWRGTSRRTKILVATGLFLLVSSTVVVGYGNYLKASETPATIVPNSGAQSLSCLVYLSVSSKANLPRAKGRETAGFVVHRIRRMWIQRTRGETPNLSIPQVHHYLAINLAAAIRRNQHLHTRFDVERMPPTWFAPLSRDAGSI